MLLIKRLYPVVVMMCWLVGPIYAQSIELGSPLIENFSPREYGYESQNYSITQDERGILFIGNLNGILEFDGIFWNLIEINGVPRLVKGFDNRIYCGGYDDFGYLGYDEKYSSKYVSLLRSDSGSIGYIGYVLEIISLQNEVLFYTADRIFKWDGEQVSVIDSSETEFSVFQVEDKVFIQKMGIGIMNYVHNGFDTLPHTEYFKNVGIREIMPYTDGSLLIKPDKVEGFMIYDYLSLKPFRTETDLFLKLNKLTCGKRIGAGLYALGTERCGFVIMNEKGKIVCSVNRETGLIDDEVADIYIDYDGCMWTALSNGFARIEFPAAFSYFGRNTGIKGGVSSILRHKGKIYAATTQGVYYLTDESPANHQNNCFNYEKFKPVAGIDVECNTLISLNGELIVTANEGVFEIKDLKGTMISEGLLETIVVSSRDSSVIYFAQDDGLSIAKFTNGRYDELGSLKKLDKHVRTIAEDDNGILWLGTDYHGVFMTDMSNGPDLSADVFQFRNDYGLPVDPGWIDVYKTSSGVLFSTQKGVFRYNYDSLRFYPDTLLGLDFSLGDVWMYPAVEDNKKNIWMSSGRESVFRKTTAVALYQGKKERYKLLSSTFNNIADFTIESIYPDNDGVVWFGSFDGIIRYDNNYQSDNHQEYKTLIRKIVVGKDSVVFCGADYRAFIESSISQYDYANNSFYFEFAAPKFSTSEEINFQYYLEGFDKNWSEWTKESNCNYTNLSEGNYRFRVRARDIYNHISEEVTYTFIVFPPIYRTWYAYIVYVLLIASFGIMIFKWREYLFAQEKNKLEQTIAEKTEEIVIQKERAEQLVANILPPDTAKELQSKGKASRKKYKMVTVLFSDIQGFTKIAEHMNPERLLDELDKFFFEFDMVVERMNIEKIKTIGDAYMCAGGIPQKNRTNPIDVVLAAIIMRQHMRKLQRESENEWDIRIGVHTGPVIAGVVGSKKLSYDIWGDTVNIASRMESSGKVGEINISETTYELVEEFFDCEPRGRIPVKYKGDISMYFVKGIKHDLSIDGGGFEPNEAFYRKLQFIRYDDLEELIMHRLEKGLPGNLYYHNLKHTIDVVVEIEILGMGELVSKDEMLLLKTAALMHDTGFLIGFDDHEHLSIKIARDTLQDYHYTEGQINTICGLIQATHPDSKPQTKLEEIMCDADLDYLGRTDYIPISQNLFRELFERGKVKTLEEWHRMQIKFIESHRYYTKTAAKMREENKTRHLSELRQLI